MKHLLLSIFGVLAATLVIAQTNDPVLMTIGKKAITKSEFEYIWNKNNTNTSLNQQSLEEYVQLFVNFKLKVAEAESQGLDTTKAFKDELDSYRQQLVSPYFTNKEGEDRIAQLTYDRIREYVEVSHILFRVAKDASPEDTLKAWNKAMEVYKSATTGRADFAALAKTQSEDVSNAQGGYLGFVTGIRFFYTFENGIYNTPVGQISLPLRTEYGYHLIKVHSRRPANGMYCSAHIMKMVKATDSPEAIKAAKAAIYAIYNALKRGEDFSTLARKESDDQSTAPKGGEYEMLYCGALPIEYENALYKVKVGEFSEPFQSNYGWHIVKPIEFRPYPAMEDMMKDINTIINKDERSQEPRNDLVEKLKKDYGSSVDAAALKDVIQAYDNLRLKKDSTGVKVLQRSNRQLYTIGKAVSTQKMFAAYLSRKPSLANNINSAFDGFMKDRVIAYEDSQLENKYPEFGHLIQEYRDGILLFEVSNKEVWEKASNDTKGLKKFFAAHKSDYAWDQPRFKGYVVECANQTVAAKVQSMVNKLPNDSLVVVLNRTFNSDTLVLIRVDNGVYAKGDHPAVDSVVYMLRSVNLNPRFPVAVLKGKQLKSGPEDYNDVKGLLIADYQNYLEKLWIDGLKKKYTVKVNESVVKTVNKN